MEPSTLVLAGILLLALITVESGGAFLVRVAAGGVPANDLQKSWYRAGHAHAAVLLVLSLTILAFADQLDVPSWVGWIARSGVPVAAILMPAGFFLSVLGKNPEKPNRLSLLIGLGAASLTAGLLAAGIGAITTGAGSA
ncbi:hypothetical protein GCM10009715_20640 [Paeniglutamicibacter psychrophenolicus]|uniref:Uncharacterized protein n=1 Tax=Paeniglutamicibacter psychrophenolicus TaxID=257454 RepID=A0ABS4WHU5_9MICC|nr:hypothetical protein [Paeniglutamicibacter psychrophenolicus]MBP2375503.1 hypothetical protein [Paeniglutamicibacter psychrophenolicus]